MMEDVERFFIEEFQSIDDIPEDVAERDKIVMEARASLLIEANCIRGTRQTQVGIRDHEVESRF